MQVMQEERLTNMSRQAKSLINSLSITCVVSNKCFLITFPARKPVRNLPQSLLALLTLKAAPRTDGVSEQICDCVSITRSKAFIQNWNAMKQNTALSGEIGDRA